MGGYAGQPAQRGDSDRCRFLALPLVPNCLRRGWDLLLIVLCRWGWGQHDWPSPHRKPAFNDLVAPKVYGLWSSRCQFVKVGLLPVGSGRSWPGQVEDDPRLGAGNPSFSRSPWPRLGAQGDRPVVAGCVSPAVRQVADLRLSSRAREHQLSGTASNSRGRPSADVQYRRIRALH